jgi:hypothetical protein
MSQPSRPWMKFYPSDWRADPLLRSCEPLSRYVWLEMIGLMHEAEPYGHLIFAGKPMAPAVLARMIAMDLGDVTAALAELDAMGVYSRDAEGAIYSRRMVRDEEKHRRASTFGKRGARAKAQKDKGEEQPLKPPHEGTPKPPHEGEPQGGHEGTHQPRVQSPDSPHIDPPEGSRRGKAPKQPLPEDFEPNDFGEETQSRAIVDGWSRLEFERQLEAFKAHHLKEGSRYSDWQSAWSTWVLNSHRFAKRDEQRAGAKPDFVDSVIEELEAEAAPKKKASGGGA